MAEKIEAIGLDEWSVGASATPVKAEPVVEAIALDDWVVKPISMDDWVVEEKTQEPIALKSTDLKESHRLETVKLIDTDLRSHYEPELEQVQLEESDLREAYHEDVIKLDAADIAEPTAETDEEEFVTEQEIVDDALDVDEEITEIEETLSETIQEGFDEDLDSDSFAETEEPEGETTNLEEDALYSDIDTDGDGLDVDEDEHSVLTETEHDPFGLKEEDELRTQLEEVAPIETSCELKLSVQDLAINHVKDITGVLSLTSKHLMEENTLECLRLREIDLVEEHQTVKRLKEEDLFENSDETVLRLRSIDKAVNHRIVLELEDSFFIENEIERNASGQILLKVNELVDPSVMDKPEEDTGAELDEGEEVQSKKSGRTKKRAARPVKKSMDEQQIMKWCIYGMIIITLLLPFTFHFKYSWVTISHDELEIKKQEKSSIEAFFMYRTEDSWHRFYGRRFLDSRSYELAKEDYGFFTWVFFVDSGSRNIGDDYP